VNDGQPVGFTGDTLEHLNFFASGAPHGIGGEEAPTEELLRALELPAQYTALLVSGNDYLGSAPKPKAAIAYFETDPVNPKTTLTVTFDAKFARKDNGDANGLKYFWDFGDGTTAVGQKVTHTFASSQWADVKLVVGQGADTKTWGAYRQAVAVQSPSGSAPATPACGTFSAAEQGALFTAAQASFKAKPQVEGKEES
jgi:PKD repeat protein